jgi:hypothetical protein
MFSEFVGAGRFWRLRSTVAGVFTVVTGREAEENVLVSLLYVLNVLKFASWRGVGGC